MGGRLRRDNGPAAAATLFAPISLAIDSGGTLYVVDSGNGRVRAISPEGIIRTVAGSGLGGPIAAEPACGVANLTVMSILAFSGLTSAAVAVDGADNLFITDYEGRIFKVPAPAPGGARIAPHISSVLNAASYRPAVLSPGELVSVEGINLAPATARAETATLPRSLASSFLCLNGTMLPLLYVSPNRFNAQLPYTLNPNVSALVAVSNGSRVEGPYTRVNVARTDPGIFVAEGNRSVVENEDGTPSSSRNPTAIGTVIRVYLTGIGLVQSGSLITDGKPAPDVLLPAVWPAAATVGGQPAGIVYLGTTPGGVVGLAHADLRVPSVAAGDQLVVITIDGKQSNATVITVRQ